MSGDALDPNSAASSSSSNSSTNNWNRSNNLLSKDEQLAKKQLKRQLKLQARLTKLETRLHLATIRKDVALVRKTQVDLDDLLQQEKEDGSGGEALKIQHAHDPALSCSYSKEPQARSFLESIYAQLRCSLDENIKNTGEKTGHQPRDEKNTKDFFTGEARKLLQNMTKATQTVCMFDNEAALHGYTRQKFIERATLIHHSLGKLIGKENVINDMVAFASDNGQLLEKKFTQKLLSVRRVCSVGCGPACDMVGVVGFLQSIDRSIKLDQAVLLDWAIDQWSPIIGPLENIMVPTLVHNIQMAMCDIRASLFDTSNQSALGLLSPNSDECASTKDRISGLDTDLIITSYLLSETRGLWHTFFDDLVRNSKPGTLFLFADPTAWQLHIFIQRCNECMDFIWLDSSMKRRELQPLEGRVGPAVLIGMKRYTIDGDLSENR